MFMIMLILAGISIELFIITIFSYIITGIAIAFYSFTRDFNKLYLNWNNILELSTRGMSQILLGDNCILLYYWTNNIKYCYYFSCC